MNATQRRQVLEALPAAAALLRQRRARYGDEREAALADVRAFARHCTIQDPDGDPVRMAAVGWAWQFVLLAVWAMTKLSVTLKARQLGVSWLAAIYVLWCAMRRPGQTILLISKKEDDAVDLLSKVAYIWERLPAWKVPATPLTKTITFSNGSEIEAMAASPDVGRSRTANVVVLDEHAHQPFARKILLAVKAAAEHGQILSISSANGIGALHSQIYVAAKGNRPLQPVQLPSGNRLPLRVTADVGPNGWRGIFIPYDAHPLRDAAWLVAARAEMSQLSDADFAQEYPADDIEAIKATGRGVFRPADLGRQPVETGTEGEPGLVVYRQPVAGRVYIVGADVAEGLQHSDWSSASVIDRDSGEQVAQLRGRWTPDVYAARLDRLARLYGKHGTRRSLPPVIVAVERNNHGHAVLLRLHQLATPGCGYAVYRAKDKRAGWVTSNATRPVLVDQLEAAIRNSEVTLHDAGTVDQMQTFAWSDDGRPEAQEGYHDDDVLALGIAWQVRRRSFGRVLGATERAAA